MFFADKLTLGTPRKTKEGYLAVRAKAARAGIYDYLGREIDPEGKHFAADQVVKVYRPESEVFAQDSVHSFLLKPITDDHPTQPVTAKDWQSKAKGVNAGALRDGEYLAFDLVLMDAATIEKVEAGKRELSNGYSSNIIIGDGTTDTGEHFDAMQTEIRGNHIAIVAAGRAGHECRIGDVATCDAATVELLERLLDGQTYADPATRDKKPTTNAGRQSGDLKMHVLIIDGLQVPNVSDEAKAAIEKLQGQLKDANTRAEKAEGQVATLTTDKATLEGEKAALEKKLEDSKLTPAQLEKLVADRSALIAQAKAIDPAVVTDGKTEIEIRRAIVTGSLGDAAANMDDAAISGAFAIMVKDVKPADPVRNALSGGVVTVGDDKAEYEAAQAKRRQELSDAWKAPATQPAVA